MHSIYATTKARIWGTANAWSLSQSGGSDQPNQECIVELEIQGDDRNGYHLVMTPSGYFTADSWHPTKHDAVESARELFGIDQYAWSRFRSNP
jgi:hypothetical protein